MCLLDGEAAAGVLASGLPRSGPRPISIAATMGDLSENFSCCNKTLEIIPPSAMSGLSSFSRFRAHSSPSKPVRRATAALIASGCSACSAAPAQNVFGSFVPSWLVCSIIGLCAAVLCRFIFKFAGLSDQLLFPPLTYVGIAIAVALAAWLFWFGH